MKAMYQKRRLFWGWVYLGCAIVLGIVAQQWWVGRSAEKYSFYGTVLNQPRSLPSFRFKGTQGYPIDNLHLKDQWTFLFMGFSHCASICPITMAELAKMDQLLSHESELQHPNVVMITLDPHRDSLIRMKDYVQSFNSSFIGARGSEADTHHLAQFLGVAYTQISPQAQERANDYSIEHSGAIMLINPQGQLVAFFTPPHDATKLAKDFMAIQHA